MSNLFSKDEDLRKSAPYVGAEILKFLLASDHGQLSIFDIAKDLEKSNNKVSARSIYYAMIFLYSLDLIHFDEPYIIKNAQN